jgi:hypothetical protein
MANEVKLPAVGTATSYRVGRAMLFVGDLFTTNSMKPVSQIQGRVRVNAPVTWSDLKLEDTLGPDAVLERTLLGEGLNAVIPLVNDRNNTIRELLSPMGRRGYGATSDEVPPTQSVAIIPTFEIGGGLKTIQGAWHRNAGFGRLASPAVAVVVSAAGAALNAVSVPVTALTQAIPANTYLYFLPGAGKLVKVTVAAAIGATSLTTDPIPVALVSADTAYVSGTDAAPKHGLFMWDCTFDSPDLEFGNEDGKRQIINVTCQALHSFETFVPEGMKLGYPGDPVQGGFPADKFFFQAPT